jgi:hypothetical protein
MAHAGANTNSSQFYMTQKASPWLDGSTVVFGKVVQGFDILAAIDKQGHRTGKPKCSVVIVDCGQLHSASSAFSSGLWGLSATRSNWNENTETMEDRERICKERYHAKQARKQAALVAMKADDEASKEPELLQQPECPQEEPDSAQQPDLQQQPEPELQQEVNSQHQPEED